MSAFEAISACLSVVLFICLPQVTSFSPKLDNVSKHYSMKLVCMITRMTCNISVTPCITCNGVLFLVLSLGIWSKSKNPETVASCVQNYCHSSYTGVAIVKFMLN
jgi:hypothetical protein